MTGCDFSLDQTCWGRVCWLRGPAPSETRKNPSQTYAELDTADCFDVWQVSVETEPGFVRPAGPAAEVVTSSSGYSHQCQLQGSRNRRRLDLQGQLCAPHILTRILSLRSTALLTLLGQSHAHAMNILHYWSILTDGPWLISRGEHTPDKTAVDGHCDACDSRFWFQVLGTKKLNVVVGGSAKEIYLSWNITIKQ